ncbi:MAG: hypothetical protein Q8L24_02370 [bacterium]|nr:hypothetical protein [bacterium]
MHNRSLLKVLVLIAAIALPAVLFGVLLRNFTNSANLNSLALATASGLFLLGVLVVFNMLTEKFLWALIGFAICSLAIAASFYAHLSGVLGIGVLLNITLLIAAYKNTRENLKNNLTIRFRKIAHSSIGYASSGIAIFAIMAYLSLFNFSDPQSLQKTLAVAIRPLEPIFKGYIPNFSFSHTLSQTAANLLPDDLKLAPPEIKSQVVQQATERLIGMLGQYVKAPIRAGDQLIDIVYKATIGRILNYSPVVQSLILVAIGLLIFLLVKFLLIFANWIGIGIAYAIYRLLLKLKFCEIQLQSISKEVIVIKE